VIHYEVTLECSATTAPALERWMRNTHIPRMLETGCFAAIRFDRAEGRFRTVCQVANQQHFDRYITEHADRLRTEFRERFAEGVGVSREAWEQVQAWAPM
jgi:3-hydroxyisobutyrate dehydrogenase-like beta-hydroxyacid dehydrogenase